MKRIAINIAFFFSILFLPWWASALLGVISLFLFSSFYELIFWAFVSDLLYGAPVVSLYGFNVIFTLSALVLFIAVEFLKKSIRFYN